MFLYKNDVDLITECEYLKNDNNGSCLEFNNILMEQNENFLDYIKNEKESILESILDK